MNIAPKHVTEEKEIEKYDNKSEIDYSEDRNNETLENILNDDANMGDE